MVRKSWVKEDRREGREGVQTWEKAKNRVKCRSHEAVRCTLLNGSALCTEQKHMRRHKGSFGHLFSH